MKTKVCQACGEALGTDSLFCSKCGTKYEAPVVATENKTVNAMFIRKFIYSINEAALALSISTRTLNKLIAEGEITACRQGKRVGVTEWALEEYARRHEVPSGVRGELKIV